MLCNDMIQCPLKGEAGTNLLQGLCKLLVYQWFW